MGLAVSQLVAQITDQFARRYIASVGKDKIVRDMAEMAQRREQQMAAQVELLVARAIAPDKNDMGQSTP
jgi:hypothetical protein